jgi:hypothetical protein
LTRTQYTITDLLPVEYAVLLTRKSDIGLGELPVEYAVLLTRKSDIDLGFADYKRKLPQVTINRIQNVKLASFLK